MENVKHKNPRTIQIKYPAPYSQSWNDQNQNSGVSNKKSRPNNANHSNSKAHFSYSWANERSEVANERANRRAKRKSLSTRGGTQIVYPIPFAKFSPTNERKVSRPRKPIIAARRSPVKSAPAPSGGCCGRTRPDPTAPHLKYGLFTKKTNNKGQSQIVVAPEAKSRSSTADHSGGNSKEKKTKGPQKSMKCNGPTQEGTQPLFVFRSIDPRFTRQLRVSPPPTWISGREDQPRRVAAPPHLRGELSREDGRARDVRTVNTEIV